MYTLSTCSCGYMKLFLWGSYGLGEFDPHVSSCHITSVPCQAEKPWNFLNDCLKVMSSIQTWYQNEEPSSAFTEM